MNCPLCFSDASPGFNLTLEEVEDTLGGGCRWHGQSRMIVAQQLNGVAEAHALRWPQQAYMTTRDDLMCLQNGSASVSSTRPPKVPTATIHGHLTLYCRA